jgi:hypothetical protein
MKLLKSTSEPLTPALVDRFHTMTPSVTERPLEESRVDYLYDRVEHKLATPFVWVSALHKGKEYRLNGQHSSTALKRFGDNGGLPEGLKAHLDQWQIESLDELPILFRQYDVKASVRSPVDVANAYARVNPDLDGLPAGVLKLGMEGIHWRLQHV